MSKNSFLSLPDWCPRTPGIEPPRLTVPWSCLAQPWQERLFCSKKEGKKERPMFVSVEEETNTRACVLVFVFSNPMSTGGKVTWGYCKKRARLSDSQEEGPHHMRFSNAGLDLLRSIVSFGWTLWQPEETDTVSAFYCSHLQRHDCSKPRPF